VCPDCYCLRKYGNNEPQPIGYIVHSSEAFSYTGGTSCIQVIYKDKSGKIIANTSAFRVWANGVIHEENPAL